MNLSIIIPTLNEEKYIASCISCIKQSQFYQPEFIIIDAGSDDDTLEVAARQNPDIIKSDIELRGKKYASLNLGASLAKNDILLFLDADTRLPFHFDKSIFEAISNGYVGGAFNLRFDKSSFMLEFIRIINKVRYRISHNFFGDQAIFCRKEIFLDLGGFPEVSIMEASHFSKKLKTRGRIALLKEEVITSSRRFVHNGVLRTFMQDLRIYFKDIIGMDKKMDGKAYWNRIDR